MARAAGGEEASTPTKAGGGWAIWVMPCAWEIEAHHFLEMSLDQ
jgi:hypothetical protein